MKFQLKALVAALAVVAAVPAQAALDIGSSGNGELFFAVYDTVTKQSFAFDLSPQASAPQYDNFNLDDFLPSNFSNAQGTLPGVTALTSAAGSAAAGSAEIAGQNLNWTFSGTVQSQFAAFAAANADQANWQWNVVALDDTGTSTTLNGRRYLSTYANSVSFPITQSSSLFGSMSTVSTYLNAINTATPGQADPAVYLSAPSANYFTTFGDTWKGNFPDSTGAVGDSLSFAYITGRSGSSLVEKFETSTPSGFVDAKWTFTVDANGIGNLNYATAANTAPIPEPETYGMLLAGLGMIGFVARRRRAN